MARDFFRLENGIHITGLDSDVGVHILHGSAIAGTNTQEDDAEVGSLYQRTNGELYQKTISGSGTDKWTKMATIDDVTSINWRPELIRVLTSTAAPIEGGTVDLSALTDDNGSLTGADFAVGEYIAFGSGGTEVLGKITNIATNVATISYIGFDVLADNDMMLVRKYLPDAAGQENSALVFFNGTDYVKVSDFDWSLATGINLSSSYAASTGDVLANDTVEVAIQKIDGNVDSLESSLGTSQGDTNMGTFTGNILTDNTSAKVNLQELETDVDAIQTASGIAAEATNYGTFTGNIITDNSTNKEALQELETAVESISANGSANAVTTVQVIDSASVDKYNGVIWDVFISLDSAPERCIQLAVHAIHNGSGTADATDTDRSVVNKLKLGAAFNYSLTVSLSGTGTSQVMNLNVSASSAVSVRSLRRSIVS